jgi:hypothetical protein
MEQKRGLFLQSRYTLEEENREYGNKMKKPLVLKF